MKRSPPALRASRRATSIPSVRRTVASARPVASATSEGDAGLAILRSAAMTASAGGVGSRVKRRQYRVQGE